jgi:signal transduction histidine kinase
VRHTGCMPPRVERAPSASAALSAPATEGPGWRWSTRGRIASLAVVLGLAVTVVWAVTGAGYLWPQWVWFGLALPYALERGIRRGWRRPGRRFLAVQVSVSIVLGGAQVLIWLMTGLGYFWPMWALLGLALAVAAHALLIPASASTRERALLDRVEVLTQTRRGALDVQAAELQRVERDLHDGAQARLVSLGMTLGMADELVDADPTQARRLLSEARTTAGAALADLRDLVRGIYPPVLADRGLAGAVQALVLTVPIPVTLSIDLPRARLPAPVESAVYFAVAEGLANVVKHSGARTASVRARHAGGMLSVVIEDDGDGGADPDQGSGLRGIERRLAAFDGILSVFSPPGGPTFVTMEVPCESSSPKISPS